MLIQIAAKSQRTQGISALRLIGRDQMDASVVKAKSQAVNRHTHTHTHRRNRPTDRPSDGLVVNRLGGLSKWNNIGLSYNLRLPPSSLLLLLLQYTLGALVITDVCTRTSVPFCRPTYDSIPLALSLSLSAVLQDPHAALSVNGYYTLIISTCRQQLKKRHKQFFVSSPNDVEKFERDIKNATLFFSFPFSV